MLLIAAQELWFHQGKESQMKQIIGPQDGAAIPEKILATNASTRCETSSSLEFTMQWGAGNRQ
jgi:hypothetical protein